MAKLKTILKYLIVLAIFYFIVRNLYTNWGQLKSYEIKSNIIYIFLSLSAVMAAWFLCAYSWMKVFWACEQKLTFTQVYILYFQSNLSKYLPGKIWQVASATYMAAKLGVPEGIALTASLASQAYSVLSGLILILAAMAWGSFDLGFLEQYLKWTVAPIVIVLVILALRPDLLEKPLNWALRLFKMKTISLKIKMADAIELFVLYFICWLLFGLGLWFFAKAFAPLGIDMYFDITAINAAAVVIGFLALFAPGGLGVREGSMALMMAPIAVLPNPLPSAIALGYRIIVIISEIIAFGLTWVLKWKSAKS